jgi:hypothetical protein
VHYTQEFALSNLEAICIYNGSARCRKNVGGVTLLAGFIGDNQAIKHYTSADFV